VASALGSPVVESFNQPGGFSPGVAARCGLEDGRRCFIKALSSEQNPDSPAMHRREGTIAAQLPQNVPAPRLIDVLDHGGWIVLIFEDIDGHTPDLPWSEEALVATFAALDAVAASATPCPIPNLETFAERHVDSFANFRRLAAGDSLVERVDPWTRRHLDLLARLEDEFAPASAGETLLHSDVRADNLLIRPDGAIMLVDWPHACVGASWVDKVCFIPSIGIQGGPSPTEMEATLDPLADADPDAVNRVLAGLTGLFMVHGLWPDPPGLPTLRAFQRAQGEVSRNWLRTRLGLQ
jgi:hypothetical protein